MGKVITVCLPCLFAPGQRAASFVHAGDKVVCTSNQTSLSILQYFCPLPLPPSLSIARSYLSHRCVCVTTFSLSLKCSFSHPSLFFILRFLLPFIALGKNSHFLAHLYHSLISLFLPHSFIIYIYLSHTDINRSLLS